MQTLTILNRLAIFAVLWVVLTGGAVDALPYGAVAAVAATGLSLWLYAADLPHVVVWRAARFLPRFLVQGVIGGIDVARRAVDPRLPVTPGWVDLPLSSRHDAANVLLGGVVSILPGTLAAGPGGDAMEVHALNLPGLATADLRADERRILGLFDRRIETTAFPHG